MELSPNIPLSAADRLAGGEDALRLYRERWQLTPDGEPFHTHASWLQPVRHRGESAMLKIAMDEATRIICAAAARYMRRETTRCLRCCLWRIGLKNLPPQHCGMEAS